MSSSKPAGNLPHGFQVVEKGIGESFDNNGSRAQVTYIGPWESRLEFLDTIFGLWKFPTNFAGNIDQCCVNDLSTPPIAYPSPNSSVATFNPGNLETGVLPELNCLWPDRYTLNHCGDPTPRGDYVLLAREPVTGALIESGPLPEIYKPHGGDCTEITVDYVAKHTSIPFEYNNCLCENQEVINIDVPPGVFVDVVYEPSFERITIPGRDFRYSDSNYANLIVTPTQACQGSDEEGNPTDLEQVPDEVDNGLIVEAGILHLKVERMPVPITPAMRAANGKINLFPVMGFPTGSLLLQVGTPRTRTNHRCDRLYDIDLQFHIRMVDTCPTTDDTLQAALGSTCGKMGIWNRRWRRCPITIQSDPENGGSGESCCTHWQDIESSVSCGGSTTPFESTDFVNILNIFCP